MEKQLKSLVTRLRTEYILFWVVSVAVMVLYETGVLEEGALAHDPTLCYASQTLGVLAALCLIPFSLKMFSMVVTKRLANMEKEEALRSYRRWSEVRLAFLAVVVLVNLSVYYTTLSSIGGLCALLGALASLFCLPGVERIKSELAL